MGGLLPHPRREAARVPPFHEDDRVTVHHGDCLDVLRTLPDCSVDSVVTDPPYGLEFMGKDWDRPWAVGPAQGVGYAGREDNLTLPSHRDSRNANCRACGGRQRGAKRCACATPEWDRHPREDMLAFQQWCEEWAAECLRVLKPGGHMLAFGGTRTWHRLACAIEDAGFEIRDTVASLGSGDSAGLLWMHGQGFPKSLDVSKAIDKAGQGDMRRAKLIHFAAERGIDGRWLEERGVADARSFADWTAEDHVPSDRNWALIRDALGVTPDEEAAFERAVIGQGKSGAASIAYMRDAAGAYDVTAPATEQAARREGFGTALKPAFEPIVVARRPLAGTVAANVLTHGTGALNIAATRVAGLASEPNARQRGKGAGLGYHGGDAPGGSWDGSQGRWPSNVVLSHGDCTEDGCEPPCPVAELDAQSGNVRSSGVYDGDGSRRPGTWSTDFGGGHRPAVMYGDRGGASRFFPVFKYQAKAPSRERPKVDGVAHETVKPLSLMIWLAKLVTPPGGVILDPFGGSGTTAEAALAAGFRCITIEREERYLPLILARIQRQQPAEEPRPAAQQMSLLDDPAA